MSRNKQFFIKMSVFILLVIAGNMVLNSAYNRWMYYFRLSRLQDRQFAAYTDTLKYLMLGNSHNRIDPAMLGNGFSYIMPKETYTQTYFKLKHILEDTHKRPENILLSIDPVNFSPRAENELSFEGYWKKYLDFFALARETRDPKYLREWFQCSFMSYAGNYRYILMSLIFLNKDISIVHNGYVPARNYQNFAREPDREALAYEIATAYLSSFNGNSMLGEAKYYRKILGLCRDYKIHLILLRMPMSDEYLEFARRRVDLDKLDRDIAELTQENSSDFRIYDFRNEFHGKSWYFFNADHINPAGVEIVSRKLKSQLENPSR